MELAREMEPRAANEQRERQRQEDGGERAAKEMAAIEGGVASAERGRSAGGVTLDVDEIQSPDGPFGSDEAFGADDTHAIAAGTASRHPGAGNTFCRRNLDLNLGRLQHNLGNLRADLGHLRDDLGHLRNEARGVVGGGADAFADLSASLATAVAATEASLRARLGREMRAERDLFVARERDLFEARERELCAASAAQRDLSVARERELSAANARRAAEAEAAHRAEVWALRSARRAAVNRLQEAQGSVRVLCRCRPLSAAEVAAGEVEVLQPGTEHNTVGFTQAVGRATNGRR
jgi:hypothetical protein